MKRLLVFLRTRWEEIIFVGVYVNSLVAAVFTFNPWVILGVGIGGFLALGALYWLLEWLQRRRRQAMGEGGAFEVPRRAIIFTVGLQAATIERALKEIGPQYAAFLCSAKTGPVAEEVATKCRVSDYRIKVVNPENLTDIRGETEALIRWLEEKGVARQEMVVDVTGGLTPLSVGAFTVAEDYKVDSQYVISEYDPATKQPKPETMRAIFVSRYSRLPRAISGQGAAHAHSRNRVPDE